MPCTLCLCLFPPESSVINSPPKLPNMKHLLQTSLCAFRLAWPFGVLAPCFRQTGLAPCPPAACLRSPLPGHPHHCRFTPKSPTTLIGPTLTLDINSTPSSHGEPPRFLFYSRDCPVYSQRTMHCPRPASALVFLHISTVSGQTQSYHPHKYRFGCQKALVKPTRHVPVASLPVTSQ